MRPVMCQQQISKKILWWLELSCSDVFEMVEPYGGENGCSNNPQQCKDYCKWASAWGGACTRQCRFIYECYLNKLIILLLELKIYQFFLGYKFKWQI